MAILGPLAQARSERKREQVHAKNQPRRVHASYALVGVRLPCIDGMCWNGVVRCERADCTRTLRPPGLIILFQHQRLSRPVTSTAIVQRHRQHAKTFGITGARRR